MGSVAAAQQSLLRMSPEDVAARASEVILRLAEPAPTRPAAAPPDGPAPAPEPAPAPTEPGPGEPSGRAWDGPREALRMPCGRVVVREKIDGVHRYQLWEPLVGDVQYGTTRTDKQGEVWGLAQTRKYDGPLPEDPIARYDVLVEHQIKSARDAMDKMRAYVAELSLRERDKPGDPWRPAGSASGIYESRGEFIVLPRPRGLAAKAAAQRRGGQ